MKKSKTITLKARWVGRLFQVKGKTQWVTLSKITPLTDGKCVWYGEMYESIQACRMEVERQIGTH